MRGTVIKLGAFSLVCLTFTAWLAITIGNLNSFNLGPISWGRQTYELTARFDDVTGLLTNDNVKVAGVVVGKVTGIEIEQGRAKVTMAVDDRYRMTTDSAAAIRWRNLLGQRYVYLYPGTESTVLEDGDEVPNTKSVIDLGELFNRLGPIVAAIDPAQVNTFLDSITQALEGNEQQAGQIIEDLGELMGGLATRDQAIGDLVEDLDQVAQTINTRDAQIRTILDNLVAISSTFSANTDVVEGAVTDLGSVSQDAGTILRDNRDQIDDSLGSLLAVLDVVEANLDDVDTTLGSLGDATEAIYRSGRYGEWLNQTILCATVTDPPADGSCATPIVSGLEGGPTGQAGGASVPSAPPALPGPAAPSSNMDAVHDLLGLGG
jgi:phospholipid/cholesterol/gamma-HCH transport system substrate-binding protein